jgi:hypothetical protein
MATDSRDVVVPDGSRLTWSKAVRELRSALFLGSFLIGIGSGVAGLMTAGSAGNVALRIVAGVCLTYVVARLLNVLLVVDRRRLNDRIEDLCAERYRILGALERLIDRQGLQYGEAIEIDVTIGCTDADDLVVQRHVTTPNPYLYYRSVRPIVPVDLPVPTTYEDLDLRVDIEDGQGERALVFPFLTNNRVRVLVVFEPSVDREITWTLTYRPRGLWRPLRRHGVDQLVWDARSPSGRNDDATLTAFAVRFHFPSRRRGTVIERTRRGTVTRRQVNGVPGTAVWTDANPAGRRYVWDLNLDPA